MSISFLFTSTFLDAFAHPLNDLRRDDAGDGLCSPQTKNRFVDPRNLPWDLETNILFWSPLLGTPLVLDRCRCRTSSFLFVVVLLTLFFFKACRKSFNHTCRREASNSCCVGFVEAWWGSGCWIIEHSLIDSVVETFTRWGKKTKSNSPLVFVVGANVAALDEQYIYFCFVKFFPLPRGFFAPS